MRTEKFYPEGQQLLTFSSSHSSCFPRKFSSCRAGAAAAFAAPGFGSAQREPVARRLPGLPGARPLPHRPRWGLRSLVDGTSMGPAGCRVTFHPLTALCAVTCNPSPGSRSV